MRKLISQILIITLGVLMSTCHRQVLEDWYRTKAIIPISVDWSVCEVDPQNVSVFFCNENDGSIVLEHFYENNKNAIQSYVELPIGRYTVLLFNELPGQIKDVNIAQKNNFNTIMAKGVEKTQVSLPLAGDTYLNEPGQLASIIVKHFEVNADMIYYTNEPSWLKDVAQLEKFDNSLEPAKALMNLVPLNNLSEFQMKMHIQGLNNARMPALINLRNVSESYTFHNNADGKTPVTYQSTNNTRTYDSNKKDGIVSCNINIFGVLGDRSSIVDQPSTSPIILDIRFMLVDKERTIVHRSFNITDLLNFELQEDGTMLLVLNLTDSTPLPDVTPESGDGESGFDTTVEDWEIIDVPLSAQ